MQMSAMNARIQIAECSQLYQRKDGVVFEKKTYLEVYIQCKVTEFLLHDKVLSSDFD